MSYIIAIETAVPENRHNQKDITTFFVKATQNIDTQRKLRYLSEKAGIEARYSVLNDFSESNASTNFFNQLASVPSLTQRMNIFEKSAIKLALKAVLKISKFNDIKHKITHIITVTCTGLFAPGLDIALIRELNLSPSTQRSSINFMGCNAAILSLNAASNICNSIPNTTVLIVCVELCTIHFQNNDSDDFILANTLFGDGAAVAIVSSEAPSNSAIKIQSFNSLIIHKGKNDMAWQLSETGFIMNLTSYISELVNGSMKEFLKGISLDKNSIDYWAIHPGGKRILDDFSETLDIDKTKLYHSYDVLKRYGNMSSATVLFVLKQVIECNENVTKGETIFSAAFGPGLSIETMQLQYV